MREENEQPEAERPDDAPGEPLKGLQSRRAMLRLGALGASAVVTIRPANAMAVSSAITCSIRVPQTTDTNKWIAANGTLVNKNTNGAFAPPASPIPGENVRNVLLYGGTLPGFSSAQSSAYMNYIKKLTVGKQGYTCYSSLQNPNR